MMPSLNKLNMPGFVTVSLLILCITHLTHGARLLMIPVPMRSHFSALTSIAAPLAARGHYVDIFFTDGFQAPDNVESDHIRYVTYHADPTNKNMDDVINGITRDVFRYNGDIMRAVRNLTTNSESFCNRIIMDNEPALIDLESNNYDMAIVDSMAMIKCVYFIPHRLGIPFVSIADIITMEHWNLKVPLFPSLAPLEMLDYSDRMSFKEKLINTLFFILMPLNPVTCPISGEMIEKYSEYGPLDDIHEVLRKTELWLSTHDVVLDYVAPTMPNIINVGGLVTKPSKSLRTDLEQVVQESPNGFILVSFGSGIATLPLKQTKVLMDVFGRLDLLVIWRLKNEYNLIVPDNVMLVDWLPQNDLLGHQNIKLFVTHGGKNGIFEAVYHAVPMVVLPIHSEQPHNAKKIITKGFGEASNIFEIDAEDVYSKIIKVLSSDSYKIAIVKASKIFHSRDKTPSERAADGIEHILQFGGDHLRSAAFDIPWYQYWMLDVLVLVLVIIHIVVYFMIKFVNLICRKCGKSVKKQKQN